MSTYNITFIKYTHNTLVYMLASYDVTGKQQSIKAKEYL